MTYDTLQVINHPLVQHKLGLMRAQDISTKAFRELANELGNYSLMKQPKTSNSKTKPSKVGVANRFAGKQIKGKKITVVPILRAGMGMLDGVLQLIPSAKVSVVGCLYRDEETLEPVPYYAKFCK